MVVNATRCLCVVFLQIRRVFDGMELCRFARGSRIIARGRVGTRGTQHSSSPYRRHLHWHLCRSLFILLLSAAFIPGEAADIVAQVRAVASTLGAHAGAAILLNAADALRFHSCITGTTRVRQVRTESRLQELVQVSKTGLTRLLLSLKMRSSSL